MNGIILFLSLLLVLWLGRSILIPLLVATFLWYLINATATYIRKLFPFDSDENRKDRPITAKTFDWVSNILSVLAMCGLIYFFITQIQPMFRELFIALPELQHKFVQFSHYISKSLGLSFDVNMLPNIANIAANVGSSIAGIVTSTGMILVYMIFLFVEQSTFEKKFSALFPNKTKYKKVRYIIDSIDDNMKKYLFMKTLLSGITGILSYFWLQTIGVEFAGIWAFIVFITSYIPTIGAIVACGLPILYSLITTPTLQQPILTAVGLITLQIVFGNILEPKLTGKTLNLSTLAILINLVFWGVIWGIAGMFFSVPLLVAIFIITAQFDSTRWIAVLLSADGKIPDKNDDE
ncbi:MAG TPA: AI-2E family transporter [Candidatus Enterousia avicola]|uniref:AI-2E family transporter n=1 Tax=Candidatus Enterousia avicola TaxID=2840787 RepID=A0A9D1SMS9_9PROT|nr:AI-2E family transporter [Candidatus Enterousia avicola]